MKNTESEATFLCHELIEATIRRFLVKNSGNSRSFIDFIAESYLILFDFC